MPIIIIIIIIIIDHFLNLKATRTGRSLRAPPRSSPAEPESIPRPSDYYFRPNIVLLLDLLYF